MKTIIEILFFILFSQSVFGSGFTKDGISSGNETGGFGKSYEETYEPTGAFDDFYSESYNDKGGFGTEEPDFYEKSQDLEIQQVPLDEESIFLIFAGLTAGGIKLYKRRKNKKNL